MAAPIGPTPGSTQNCATCICKSTERATRTRWRSGTPINWSVGVYGVTLWAPHFFGESMFSRRTGRLENRFGLSVDRLQQTGFPIVRYAVPDAHLASLGAIEIRARTYRKELEEAINASADFTAKLSQSARGRNTADHPDVVAGMVQRVQRRGRGNHPAVKQLIRFALFPNRQIGKRVASRVVRRIAAIPQRNVQTEDFLGLPAFAFRHRRSGR